MYNEEAKKLRRCEAMTMEGMGPQCKGYARFDSNYCTVHLTQMQGIHHKRVESGNRTLDKMRQDERHRQQQKAVKAEKVCKCEAYNFPHRKGGGLCLWPLPPLQKLTTKAGTLSKNGSMKRALRASGICSEMTNSITLERQGEIVSLEPTPETDEE